MLKSPNIFGMVWLLNPIEYKNHFLTKKHHYGQKRKIFFNG